MSNGEDFKAGEFQGKIIQELEFLKKGQEAIANTLTEFREKMGTRTGDNEKVLAIHDGKIETILMVGRWIFAPVFSVIGVGIIIVIARYLLRR